MARFNGTVPLIVAAKAGTTDLNAPTLHNKSTGTFWHSGPSCLKHNQSNMSNQTDAVDHRSLGEILDLGLELLHNMQKTNKFGQQVQTIVNNRSKTCEPKVQMRKKRKWK